MKIEIPFLNHKTKTKTKTIRPMKGLGSPEKMGNHSDALLLWPPEQKLIYEIRKKKKNP